MTRIRVVRVRMTWLVFVTAMSTWPASATVIYPWCTGGSHTGSCGYTSLKQCLETLWGTGGTCNPNPYYQPYPPSPTYSPPIRR